MEDAHDLDQRLFAVEWAPVPCVPDRTHPGDWLIVAEDSTDPLPERLVAALVDRGGRADIVRSPLDCPAPLGDLAKALATPCAMDSATAPNTLTGANNLAGANAFAGPAGPAGTAGFAAPIRGIVIICPPASSHADEAGLLRARQRVSRVLAVARLLTGAGIDTGTRIDTGMGIDIGTGVATSAGVSTVPPRLVVVTRDAQPVRTGDGSALEHSALRGLCRAVAAEHPELATVHVDLPVGVPVDSLAASLAAEVLADRRNEDEVAWRDGLRFVASLRPAPLRDEDRRTTTIYFGHDGVAIEPRGQALELVHRPRRRPGMGEVELAVRVIAVKDLDALLSEGGPGMRCSGVVATVGRGVTAVRVGQRVTAVVRTTGTFLTMLAGAVAPIPDELSFEEAVGEPSTGRRAVLPAVPYSLDAFVRAFASLRTDRRSSPIVVTLPKEGAVRVPVPPHRVPVVRHEGSYVISGGLGRLGLLSARWLATSGAGRIILGGRSELTAYADLVLDELRQTGAQIEVVQGDIGDPAVARAMVCAATATGLPLRGVVHAAAVVEDARLSLVDDGQLDRVFQPKMLGAWHLHHACAEEPLDWWLGFSSASALLGRAGRAACAAANSWLDGFTIWRRAQGLPALSIGWGSWIGHDQGTSVVMNDYAMIRPEEGIDVCDRLLRHSRAHTGYLSLADWLAHSGEAARTSAFFSSIEIGAAAKVG